MLFPKTKTGAAAAYKGCKKYNPLCFVNRWGESAAMNAPRVNLFFMRENSSKGNTFIWNTKYILNKNLQGDFFQFCTFANILTQYVTIFKRPNHF